MCDVHCRTEIQRLMRMSCDAMAPVNRVIAALVASLTDKLLSCTWKRENAATLILSDCGSKIGRKSSHFQRFRFALLDRYKYECITDQELTLAKPSCSLTGWQLQFSA